MSLSENRTGELWRGFMSRRKEIRNTIGTDRYSVQLYDPLYFTRFRPNNTFEKWAAIEVSDYAAVPPEMETFTLEGGLYAVFNYKGTASQGATFFEYIFQNWLSASDYELDIRPHFEVLGEKYKNEDPESEEEIWIPVRKKPVS